MASGLAVVRPEGRSPIVDALRDGRDREARSAVPIRFPQREIRCAPDRDFGSTNASGYLMIN
jgi:hypothetical protein